MENIKSTDRIVGTMNNFNVRIKVSNLEQSARNTIRLANVILGPFMGKEMKVGNLTDLNFVLHQILDIIKKLSSDTNISHNCVYQPAGPGSSRHPAMPATHYSK